MCQQCILQILYNIEPDADFLEFAAQQHAAKQDASGTDSKRESKDKDEGVNPTADEGVKRTSRKLSMHRSASELDHWSSHHLHTKGPYNASTRSAAEVLTNKRDMTDQEFEDIIELCEVKFTSSSNSN